MKIAIISDIHGNLRALHAVIGAVKDADLLVCLGDVVDYGPQPAECVDIIQSCAHIAVMGNHDFAVANHADPGCSQQYRHLAEVTRDLSIRMLDLPRKRFLHDLPLHARFTRGGARFSAVHARPSNRLYGYLPLDTPDSIWESEVELDSSPDVLLLGHTHLPIVKTIGQTIIVNPGSVGQPKDGDPRAAYAIWEDGEVALCRADYDVWATADAFKETDLQPGDVARLVAVLRSGGAETP